MRKVICIREFVKNPVSKMICIREYVKNPANALEYMCDGLENQDERPDFGVDMGSYGSINHHMTEGWSVPCFGCAATCTVQEIAGINLTEENIENETLRSEALNFDTMEFVEFESAIDRARTGSMYELWHFFGLNASLDPRPTGYAFPTLDSGWRLQIPAIRKYIEELRRIKPQWAKNYTGEHDEEY